ncbi:ribonuclease-3 [Dysgonomonas sp. PH5-45]|uniref:ribonuclease III n=1 Tax=unclassified Dysgonomonas TaxID=2630389 RepID=UPI002476C021|nr:MULTISPECIES: ribonuclease III [unclassified Dysgonomonas]MDH6355685.1 ribonuclease-3 [Dysgonomonas sp. PH5-45]MDH6388582.1 ribonuclease-3 [Dysgonomonas sp. PH5-37]
MLKKLYRSVRLLPKRGREPYCSFYKILHFYPYNITLYKQALLHKSSSIKMKDGRWINNERLEFLGDAILDAIVADIVFKEFEYKKEGFLTDIRSRIVQRETLNRLALELGIDKLIKASTRSSTHKTHMYGNALEALIGAIYLDQGYRKTKKFVLERLIKDFLNIDVVAQKEINFKSRLIEWGQKNKIEVTFTLIDAQTDENNNPIFTTAVYLLGQKAGVSKGYSKKESQQKAAEIALKKILRNESFRKQIMELKAQESIASSQPASETGVEEDEKS